MQIRGGRFAFAAILLLMGTLPALAQGQAPAGAASVRLVEVSAKKYEFTPDEIHVRKGEKVELQIHSVDETHGIKLSLYPEGSKHKSAPGLLFSDRSANGKVKKGQDQVLVFVAREAGTYEFKCAKLCGLGHRGMKGKLVVDE